MNMDLIQNTAALMGKVTADETLRLKLQQAILLGNSKEAGNLAQELLSSQYAAMRLSGSNPLGGFSDALLAALKAVRDLRDELALLGAPRVLIPSTVINNGSWNGFGMGGNGTPGTEFPDEGMPSENPIAEYVDDFMRRNQTSGALTNVIISIDPDAAALGISAAVVNNAANGNSNDFRRTGTGF
jgi:hypothetical protein